MDKKNELKKASTCCESNYQYVRKWADKKAKLVLQKNMLTLFTEQIFAWISKKYICNTMIILAK